MGIIVYALNLKLSQKLDFLYGYILLLLKNVRFWWLKSSAKAEEVEDECSAPQLRILLIIKKKSVNPYSLIFVKDYFN